MDDSHLRSLLLRFLEAGDARAMEEFVASTRPRLLKAARRIGSPQDADDSVQAAYHALLQRGPEIPPGPLFPWLLVATIRIAYRRKAMQQRARALGDRLAVPAPEQRPPELGPLDSAARLEEARLVRDAITRLPSRYRDVVVLHYIEGLTAAEAARLLDVSRSTITTRLLRARRLLRSRLPQLTYALLLLPWLAADGWAAFGPVPSGAVMKGGGITLAWKAKSLVVVSLLAAGGAGMAIGHSNPTTHASPRSQREHPDPRVADLQDEIEELRQTNRSLQARLSEPPERQPAVEQPEAKITAPPPIPDAIRSAGARLGVRDELVEAAWRALNASSNDEKRVQIEILKRGGKQGYLAYATLLYGSKSGPEISDRLAELWSPQYAGAEEALIEFIGLEKSYGYAKWSAYRSLGSADTPASRDFLVRAAATEEQDGYYLSLAQALGELKEPRAFDDLARRIANKKWHRNVRGPIMHALIKIDPDRAKQVLIDHLRADGTDLLLVALHYLGMVDAELRKSEARALLEGPRARSLDGDTLRGVKRLVR